MISVLTMLANSKLGNSKPMTIKTGATYHKLKLIHMALKNNMAYIHIIISIPMQNIHVLKLFMENNSQ